MRVVNATESHLRAIKVRDLERKDLGENLDDETIRYYLSSRRKLAIIDDSGEVVAVMGGIVSGSDCHTWLIGSDLIYKYPVLTMRTVMRIHQEGVVLEGVKRFYTYNLPSMLPELNFVKKIGYAPASVTSEFDDNKERILLIKEVA